MFIHGAIDGTPMYVPSSAWNYSKNTMTYLSKCYNSSPLNKMAAISQTIFSDAFLWMESFIFWSKFHRGSFLRDQLTDNMAALVQGVAWRQAITWTNANPVHWRIYAALGGYELKASFTKRLDDIKTWTNNYTNCIVCDIITHPCPNLD